MAEMLSPGVYVTEIDASTIAPTVSNSIAVFAGNFDRGPVGKYRLVTNVKELIDMFGLPNDVNYNDWYQAYNFLQYANKLFVARAANVGGTAVPISGEVTQQSITANSTNVVDVVDTNNYKVGDFVSFGGSETNKTFYMVVGINSTAGTISLDRNVEDDIALNTKINTYFACMSGQNEAVSVGGTEPTEQELVKNYVTILNEDDWEQKEGSIAFTSPDAKIKVFARDPGNWAEKIEVAIAKPNAFKTTKPSMAFDGLVLNEFFEYYPTGTEVGIIVRVNDEVKEVFTVDFDPTARDSNNKSTYIETVINNKSNYIFVKDNTANSDEIDNYLFSVDGVSGRGPLTLKLGADSAIQEDDLLDAYDLWSNKEEVDIDIVIANELSPNAARNLVDARKDCIGFIGAPYDIVGKKASVAVSMLVGYRTEGAFAFNNMFLVAGGNYKYQYDRYNDKNRWVNIAGDIAGLRAQTSTNRASWWASAGLERGQIKNVIKLAFNPNQGQRDILYKNAINPIVTFPGQGTVMWGQKTLLDKPSSFDRVNVRGLFNTLERSLSKMAKYQVMEFNDTFTRNRIVSMIKPFLESVRAGRGIQDYLVICDESNNTPDVISRNQLVVDIFIKPTYVAEFIHLRFTNAGTNSFAQVIGG